MEKSFASSTHMKQKNREYTFGHKYFSAEKSRDPASPIFLVKNMAPASDSSRKQRNLLSHTPAGDGGIGPPPKVLETFVLPLY